MTPSSLPPTGQDDRSRLIAWYRELTATHERLRRALRIPQADLTAATTDESWGGPGPRTELLLFCHGFCVALRGHHQSEDGALFPVLAARWPRLGPVIDKLREDHAMIAALLQDWDAALEPEHRPTDARRGLDGIAAIMESHFRYEERELGSILARLDLDVEPRHLLGPL